MVANTREISKTRVRIFVVMHFIRPYASSVNIRAFYSYILRIPKIWPTFVFVLVFV